MNKLQDITTYNESILIVEDDDIYALRLKQAFLDRGYFAVRVSGLDELKTATKEFNFNYVIIDLRLKNESGLNALSYIVKNQAECRALLLTGFGTISTAVEAMRLGAVNYLTKPANPDQIIQALTDLSTVKQEKQLNYKTDMPSLEQVEWEHIQNVLSECGGNITIAAKKLNMHRRSLQRKLAKDPRNIK